MDLPIVSFGKYRGKSVVEMATDTSYIEWCKTQPGIMEKHKNIFNIIINKQMPSQNSDTPEHNYLQNKFLELENKYKLVKAYFKLKLDDVNKILEEIYNTDEFKEMFGQQRFNERDSVLLKDNLEKSKIVFEAIYNWDIALSNDHSIRSTIQMNSDYLKMKEDEIRKQYEGREYVYKSSSWSWSQHYDLETYKGNYSEILSILTQEYSRKQEQYDDEKARLLEEIESLENNNHVTRDRHNGVKYNKQVHYHSLGFTLYGWAPDTYLPEDTCKKPYVDMIKDFNKKFDESFQEQFILYIEKKVTKMFYKLPDLISIYKNNISLSIERSIKFKCELKPLVGDDYPSILRKMKSQMIMTRKDDDNSRESKFVLIIGEFLSKITSKEQLVEIFAQSGIKVLFAKEDLDIIIQYSKPSGPCMISEESDESIRIENVLLKEENFKLKQTISELKKFIASQIQ